MSWFVPLEVFRLDPANTDVTVTRTLALDVLLPHQVGLQLRSSTPHVACGDDRAPVDAVVMFLVAKEAVGREIAIAVGVCLWGSGVWFVRGRLPGVAGIVICPRHHCLSKQ
jgi:hypothetical protein